MQNEDKPIGYLVVKQGERGFRVVGECCAKHWTKGSAVYAVNLNPYRQRCVQCGRELINAGSPACELYDGK